jgi:glucokinase
MKTIIGVDVGGTQLRAALFDTSLNLLERSQQDTNGAQGADAVLDRLYETIRQVMPEDTGDLVGIGLGLPGPLDQAAGTLISPPNLPFKGEVPFRKLVQDAIGGSVFLGNDADVAALAEHQQGAGKGTRNMVYLTVSTGVGGGIIIDGMPYSGRGQGGELGHMVIVPDGGPICGCGKYGHLEALASGTGMSRIAQARIEGGSKSALKEMVGGDLTKLSGRLVGQAAQEGDVVALDIVRQAGRSVGVAIATLMMALNPDMFVIGGGVSKLGDLLFKPMHEAIREFCMVPKYWENTPIERVQLGDDVGLIGAAALVKVNKKL